MMSFSQGPRGMTGKHGGLFHSDRETNLKRRWRQCDGARELCSKEHAMRSVDNCVGLVRHTLYVTRRCKGARSEHTRMQLDGTFADARGHLQHACACGRLRDPKSCL